jgi:hypothetical protein
MNIYLFGRKPAEMTEIDKELINFQLLKGGKLRFNKKVL